MTFKLKYNYNIKKYKVFYSKLSLVNYINNNYINNIKSKLLKISYIYILNKIKIF